MNREIATQWFNQFTPAVIAEYGVEATGQWCARHWAPCPILGGNGLKAAVLMAEAAVMNAFPNDGEPWCCRVGDVGMFFLWGACPPAGMTSSE